MDEHEPGSSADNTETLEASDPRNSRIIRVVDTLHYLYEHAPKLKRKRPDNVIELPTELTRNYQANILSDDTNSSTSL